MLRLVSRTNEPAVRCDGGGSALARTASEKIVTLVRQRQACHIRGARFLIIARRATAERERAIFVKNYSK